MGEIGQAPVERGAVGCPVVAHEGAEPGAVHHVGHPADLCGVQPPRILPLRPRQSCPAGPEPDRGGFGVLGRHVLDHGADAGRRDGDMEARELHRFERWTFLDDVQRMACRAHWRAAAAPPRARAAA